MLLDVPHPLAGMHELYSRTPGSKQIGVLARADHLHFMDNVEQAHEQLRATTPSPTSTPPFPVLSDRKR